MSALTLAVAHDLIDQAMVHATQNFKKPVCVSVCDASGLLLAFVRMEGAPVRSVAISQGKGYSAARMGVTTQAVLERLHRENIEIGYFCDPLLTALPGGSPLKDKAGMLCGAIGVSGLTSAEDQQVTDFIAGKFAA
ncbi:MAG: GlcG/HbpS family heme-binding protein [Hylemonella sp.]